MFFIGRFIIAWSTWFFLADKKRWAELLPKRQNIFSMFKYIFLWSFIAITIEWIHLYTGYMQHLKFLNLGLSYICDWILFIIFYSFYRIHNTHLLNHQSKNLRNLADIVIFLDSKGALLECFSDWFNTIQYNPRKDIGKSFIEIKGLRNANVHREAFYKVLGGENIRFNFDWESPRGILYSFENSLSPIIDDENKIIGMVGILNLS